MKKLMMLMLGMGLAFGSVAVTFGQDQPPTKESKKKSGKKKGSKKKTEEPKKEGSK